MTALLDSNVLVAGVIESHPAHDASFALLSRATGCATSVQALSEVYNTLTKPRIYGWKPVHAADTIMAFEQRLTVVGLSITEHIAAIASFAALGGIGPTVHDYVLGASARHAGIKQVVTLNAQHFIRFFPDLTILTPSDFMEMP